MTLTQLQYIKCVPRRGLRPRLVPLTARCCCCPPGAPPSSWTSGSGSTSTPRRGCAIWCGTVPFLRCVAVTDERFRGRRAQTQQFETWIEEVLSKQKDQPLHEQPIFTVAEVGRVPAPRRASASSSSRVTRAHSSSARSSPSPRWRATCWRSRSPSPSRSPRTPRPTPPMRRAPAAREPKARAPSRPLRTPSQRRRRRRTTSCESESLPNDVRMRKYWQNTCVLL